MWGFYSVPGSTRFSQWLVSAHFLNSDNTEDLWSVCAVYIVAGALKGGGKCKMNRFYVQVVNQCILLQE